MFGRVGEVKDYSEYISWRIIYEADMTVGSPWGNKLNERKQEKKLTVSAMCQEPC